MLSPAEVLNERYRLDAPIASGGMGEVWRATDLSLDRTVALKVMRSDRLASPGFDARFRAEARTMAALHHPNVVNIYDYGSSPLPDGNTVSYLVMTYVEGESLRDRLATAGRLPVEETMTLLAQAADALHAAHQRGIVHRDVKPANLLVQPDGTVVLVDFGVARSATVTSVTTANGILGTALYMAPEQASGRPVSAAADIYALGAVAFHCLAGAPPFPGETALEVALRHVSDEPPPLPANLPAGPRSLVSRALNKDPADRFPDAAAFAAAARRIAADPDTVLDDGDGAAGEAPDGASATAGSDRIALVAGAAAGGAAGDPSTTQVPDEVPHRPLLRRPMVLAGLGAVLVIGVAGVALLLNPGGSTPLPPPETPATSTAPVLPGAAPATSATTTRRPATVTWSTPASAGATSAAVPSESASAASSPQPSHSENATPTPAQPSQSASDRPSPDPPASATASAGTGDGSGEHAP